MFGEVSDALQMLLLGSIRTLGFAFVYFRGRKEKLVAPNERGLLKDCKVFIRTVC